MLEIEKNNIEIEKNDTEKEMNSLFLMNLQEKMKDKIKELPNEPYIIPFKKDYSASLLCETFPFTLSQEEFNTLWNLHPPQTHIIHIHSLDIPVYRYSQSYLQTPHPPLSFLENHSYMYSGKDMSTNQQSLPSCLQPFMDEMQKKDKKYNQVIVNWYEDQSHFISFHSDCLYEMIPNAPISILSLYDPSQSDLQKRSMMFRKKKEKKSFLTLPLHDQLLLTMNGTIQHEYQHGILEETNECARRISISFRQMIESETSEK